MYVNFKQYLQIFVLVPLVNIGLSLDCIDCTAVYYNLVLRYGVEWTDLIVKSLHNNQR
jgi:hypothetical protein